MNRKHNLLHLLFFVGIIMLTVSGISVKNEVFAGKASYHTYEVGPKTKPCDNSAKYTTYNKYTKQYYTIASYLKRLEKEGGGTLIIKKGNYLITNALYIPDHVTVKLKKGVVMKKGNKTGTKKFTPSGSMFSLCSWRLKDQKGVICEYNGAKDINIIGEGNPVIDLDYIEGALGIIMGHNQKVNVSGITFKNMNTGHFIEMDASKGVKVTNCTFMNHKDSYSNGKEAINIDTPDSETKGFNVIWSSHDMTPNKDVLITDCKFKNLERAVGTHKYSQDMYHTNVRIVNNVIDGCDNDAIRVMNWQNFTITDNVIKNVGAKGSGKRAILVSGASKMKITNNLFDTMDRPIQFIVWKNNDGGREYEMIYNVVTDNEFNLMKENTLVNVKEHFIRFNHVWNQYLTNTDKIQM